MLMHCQLTEREADDSVTIVKTASTKVWEEVEGGEEVNSALGDWKEHGDGSRSHNSEKYRILKPTAKGRTTCSEQVEPPASTGQARTTRVSERSGDLSRQTSARV